MLGLTLLSKGDASGALTAIQQEGALYWRQIGLPIAWHALGNKAESDAALAELIRAQEKQSSFYIAEVYAFRGEADRAFEWLDKAVVYQNLAATEIGWDPLFANIHDDPRWLPFLRKLGLAPEQLAAIEFELILPP